MNLICCDRQVWLIRLVKVSEIKDSIIDSSRICFLRTKFSVNFLETSARKYPEKQLLIGDLRKHFLEKFYKFSRKYLEHNFTKKSSAWSDISGILRNTSELLFCNN